ncbi:MAG TPA: AsmA family protein [Alphaproteobacteria bacterium]
MFGFGFVFRLISRVIGFVARVVVFAAAVIAVAAGVAYALFDGEQYKKHLSQRVVDLTGRVLQVNGAAELQLSVPPRIVLNDVHLKNARWGTRADMARIKRVEIQLNPLAAVSGGDPVAQVRLDGADVMLETNAQGVGNWEVGALAASPVAAGALSAVGLFGNTPTSVSVSDARVTFRDGATGRVQTASLGNVFQLNSLSAASPAGGSGAAAGVAGVAAGAVASAGSPSALLPEALFGGSTGGSRALAAANSDNTNPCDGSPQSTSQQQSRVPPSRPR